MERETIAWHRWTGAGIHFREILIGGLYPHRTQENHCGPRSPNSHSQHTAPPVDPLPYCAAGATSLTCNPPPPQPGARVLATTGAGCVTQGRYRSPMSAVRPPPLSLATSSGNEKKTPPHSFLNSQERGLPVWALWVCGTSRVGHSKTTPAGERAQSHATDTSPALANSLNDTRCHRNVHRRMAWKQISNQPILP